MFRCGQNYGEIVGIYLLKKYQGNGIGKALFNSGARLLKENGFHQFALWVLKDNPTTNFYQKLNGQQGEVKEIEIGGKKLLEVAYLWNEIIPTLIFHITSEEEWKKSKVLQIYKHPSLEKEGFIHFSELHQVHRIANSWYREMIHPIVLEVDPIKLSVPIKHESGGGEETFPHVYGPIPLSFVFRVRKLEKSEDGFFKPLH